MTLLTSFSVLSSSFDSCRERWSCTDILSTWKAFGRDSQSGQSRQQMACVQGLVRVLDSDAEGAFKFLNCCSASAWDLPQGKQVLLIPRPVYFLDGFNHYLLRKLCKAHTPAKESWVHNVSFPQLTAAAMQRWKNEWLQALPALWSHLSMSRIAWWSAHIWRVSIQGAQKHVVKNTSFQNLVAYEWKAWLAEWPLELLPLECLLVVYYNTKGSLLPSVDELLNSEVLQILFSANVPSNVRQLYVAYSLVNLRSP